MENQAHIAKLSHGAYESHNKAQRYANEHNYEVVPEFTDMSDKRSHTLYRNKETGEHVLSFRGTHKRSLAKDLIADAQLALGLKPKELKNAEALTRQVKEKVGDKLILSGHSYGGSKAIYAGKTTNTRSITHNPYVGVGLKKGLKDYYRDTGSEAHLHVNDVIGSSAMVHVPKTHVVAYTHDVKQPHGIKGFHNADGVRLSKRSHSTRAMKLAKVGAVASTAAALTRETVKALKK